METTRFGTALTGVRIPPFGPWPWCSGFCTAGCGPAGSGSSPDGHTTRKSTVNSQQSTVIATLSHCRLSTVDCRLSRPGAPASNIRLQNGSSEFRNGVQLPSWSLRASPSVATRDGYERAPLWASSSGQDRRFSIVVRGFDSPCPRHLPSLVDPSAEITNLGWDVRFVPRVPTPVERLSTRASEACRGGSTPPRETVTDAR
jgi:hypothetical protein